MSNELSKDGILSFTQTKLNGAKVITLPIKIIKNKTTIIKFNNKPIHINNNQPIKNVFLNNNHKNIINPKNSHNITKKKSCRKMSIYLKKKINNNNNASNQVIMRKVIPPLPIPQNNQLYYSCLMLSNNNSRNGSNNITQSLEFTFQRKKDSDVDLSNYEIKNGLSYRSRAESVNDYSNNYKTHREKRQINFSPIKINSLEYKLNQAKSIIDRKFLLNNKSINNNQPLQNKHEIYFDFPNRK